MLDRKLLEILVCPICKKDLIFDNHEVGEQPNTADILAAKFKSSTTGEAVQ